MLKLAAAAVVAEIDSSLLRVNSDADITKDDKRLMYLPQESREALAEPYVEA